MTDISSEAVDKAANRLKRKSGLFNSYTLEAEMLCELRQKLTDENARNSRLREEIIRLQSLYDDERGRGDEINGLYERLNLSKDYEVSDLMTRSQVAKALDMDPSHIRYAFMMGWIPSPVTRVAMAQSKRSCHVWHMWLRQDIEEFVAEKAKRVA